MKYTYKSKFANDIEIYINKKVALGFSPASYDRRLHDFDNFCLENYPDENQITEEIVSQWSCLREGRESKNGLHRRMIALKGFLKYKSRYDKDTFVIPEGTIGKDKPFQPYIFTDSEIKIFFKAADTLTYNPSLKQNEYTVPVIFRVLFCCGLRPGEVLRIQFDELNLEIGTIYISKTKTHKDRTIVMNEELLSLCNKYNEIINVYYPERKYFFAKSKNEPYSTNWLQIQFKKCWRESNIVFPALHHPRVYDWRHNHASRVIMNWVNQGLDAHIMLPYLSQYLGHAELKSTLYYIHLLPDKISHKDLNDWKCNLEVPVYED